MLLKIATDFSTAPGPRHVSEGKFSGEAFRKQFLHPRVQEAIKSGDTLTVDFDGTSGYGTSFLEESFGGLIRDNGLTLDEIDAVLDLVSDEEPELLDEIRSYMEDAEKIRKAGG